MNEYNDHDEEWDDDENTIYSIADLEGFCREVRRMVAFDMQEADNKMDDKYLDEFITVKQVEGIVHEKCLGEEDGKIYLNIETYEDIANTVGEQIFGASLSKLAAEGILEVAWDDEINDMVFWLNEDTPETRKLQKKDKKTNSKKKNGGD